MAFRLSKATRVLQMELRYLVDFLHELGYNDIVEDLNQKLSDEQYYTLLAAFSIDEIERRQSYLFLHDFLVQNATNNMRDKGCIEQDYLTTKSIIERKRVEIIERKHKEEEIKKKEKEEEERKEREKRLLIEKSRKEHLSKEKKDLLYRISHTYKSNAFAYIDYLRNHNIRYLYHFTDIHNLQSIIDYGGLFSWEFSLKNDINIPVPGGDETSRSLDKHFGLSDYVRLSFCERHPMAHYLYQTKGYSIIVLRVKIDVVGLEGTLFSDMNATDTDHHHGGNIEDLKRINLSATQEDFVNRESDIFKNHQAEVLVRTFIPIEYIELPH